MGDEGAPKPSGFSVARGVGIYDFSDSVSYPLLLIRMSFSAYFWRRLSPYHQGIALQVWNIEGLCPKYESKIVCISCWRQVTWVLCIEQVNATFYANEALQELIFDELKHFNSSGSHGGFLPAVKQLANVAALPGIVKSSIGMVCKRNTTLLE